MTKEAFSQSGVRLTSEVQQAVAVGDGDQAEGLLRQIEELTAATEAPADRLIRLLHPWSSFLVLPIFALANAGVVLTTETLQHALAGPVSVSRGILVGLVIGKPLGIASFAFFAVRLRLARLVGNVRWAHLFGVGFLGGIGFTVSLFISDLAFADPAVADRAKMGVLIGSLVAGIAGYLILRVVSARVARSRIARQGI